MNRLTIAVVVLALTAAAYFAGTLSMRLMDVETDQAMPNAATGSQPAATASDSIQATSPETHRVAATRQPSPAHAAPVMDVKPSIEQRMMRTRSAADYQRALLDDFAELQAEMALTTDLNPGLARLAEAYHDQIALLFEENEMSTTVSRVSCGNMFCVAEVVTPVGDSPPSLRSRDTRSAGLGLSIVGSVNLATPNAPAETRILFVTMGSPKP